MRQQRDGGRHCADVMAVKTLAATAMVGAQTTINNQIKAATATVTETAMIKKVTMMAKEKR